MNIYEQLRASHYIIIDGTIFTNNYTPWRGELTIFGYDPEIGGDVEFNFGQANMDDAVHHNHGWKLDGVINGQLVSGITLEFCLITPVETNNRRSHLVSTAITVREEKNTLVCDLMEERDECVIETTEMRIAHLNNFLSDLEEEITKIDYPDGLT